MSMLLKLVQLLSRSKIPEDWYCIYNESGKRIAGVPDSGFQLEYKSGWHVYLSDSYRGGVWADEAYSTLREACIAFLKRSDEYFHLASHIPEFEEQAAS